MDDKKLPKVADAKMHWPTPEKTKQSKPPMSDGARVMTSAIRLAGWAAFLWWAYSVIELMRG